MATMMNKMFWKEDEEVLVKEIKEAEAEKEEINYENGKTIKFRIRGRGGRGERGFGGDENVCRKDVVHKNVTTYATYNQSVHNEII